MTCSLCPASASLKDKDQAYCVKCFVRFTDFGRRLRLRRAERPAA